MRYFFLLLLITFLCTCGRAQNFTITASIGLASEQCNPVINDPGTDCINVPVGDDMLTYLPGQDSLIIITYRLTNNTGGTIAQALVTDSDRGTIVPVSTVNITPGMTVTTSRIFPAELLPRTVNPTVTAVLESAGGMSLTVEGTYTLEVVAPAVTTDFSLVRKLDACPGDLIAPECAITDYGNLSLTVGATDTFITRFNWDNTGLTTYDMSELVDQDGEVLSSTGFNQVPGQELIGAHYLVAPAELGTYNYSQTVEVTDFAGNSTSKTVNYTIIVEGPKLETDFSLVRKTDACPGDVIAPECTGANYGNFTITAGALDTLVTRFDWENAGLGTFDASLLVDQDGEELANTGFNQVTGQRLISAQFIIAPATPGMHAFSQTITVTDFGGNEATHTYNFTVIVEAPSVNVEFGVANQNDVCPDQPTAPNCSVPYGPMNGQQITVGAGDTVTTRFAWTNTGLGTWDMENLVDQDGETLANTGFDQKPGQTLISAHHLIAPGEPGIYDWSQTLTITDKGGNTATETVTFEVKVDCAISDLAPPTARCRDRSFTIMDGETQTINAGMINDGSSDGCGDLAGGGIDITSFSCVDEGTNTVTLTVGDLAGNSASCTSTVTINIEDAIYEGPDDNCVSTSVAVSGGQAWQDITTTNGKMIAQVIIGNNTNIASVKVNIYKSAISTEDVDGQAFLSKRINLQMLNGTGSVVQPNNEPVYVRLYYTEAEMDDLMAASSGSSPGSFTIIKTSGNDCGTGYTGTDATEMNATFNSTGCAGEDGYLEFFTGAFSTFYLFATNAILPVELTTFEARGIEKQRVKLDWMTTTETGNDRFDIEHSKDGRTFVALGAVAGAGDSSEEQWYDFVHENPVPGLNYYRLRQVDYDGTETLSEVRVVEIEIPTSITVYPNPTTDELRLRGFAGGTARIIDARGRPVITRELLEGQPLDVRNLPSGVYLLQLPTETLRWIKR